MADKTNDYMKRAIKSLQRQETETLTPNERDYFIRKLKKGEWMDKDSLDEMQQVGFFERSKAHADAIAKYLMEDAYGTINHDTIGQAVEKVLASELRETDSHLLYRALHKLYDESLKQNNPKLQRAARWKDSNWVERGMQAGMIGALGGAAFANIGNKMHTQDLLRGADTEAHRQVWVDAEAASKNNEPLTADNLEARFQKHQKNLRNEAREQGEKDASSGIVHGAIGIAGAETLALAPNAIGALANSVLQKRRRREKDNEKDKGLSA